MPVATLKSFVEHVLQSQLLDAAQRAEVLHLQASVADARTLAQELLRREWLTAYQINQIFQGKSAGLVLGPYQLLDRLGTGGMGQVYKARQKMLNRLVALKVIRTDCLDHPNVVPRFQREIRAASQLCHPHIVRAYDADQIKGTYYFAMELIDGVDLSRLIKEQGPLRVDQACEYIRQAALGLQHAHERGLVHRDVKPANLLITRAVTSDRRRSSGYIRRPVDLSAKPSGQAPRTAQEEYPWGMVKILDLGLALCHDPFTGRAATHLTQVGSVMGTPEYLAPEQARDSHCCDIRSDLYSLGCTLYFLLAGQPPFPKGTLTEKLLHHQYDEPASLPRVRRERLQAWQGMQGPTNTSADMLAIPTPVVGIVYRLMAKEPADRFQTPLELADALQALLPALIEKMPPVTAVPCAKVKSMPGDAATVMQPIVQLPPPARSPLALGKIGMLLALMSGLVLLLIVTVVVLLLSQSSITHAHQGTAKRATTGERGVSTP